MVYCGSHNEDLEHLCIVFQRHQEEYLKLKGQNVPSLQQRCHLPDDIAIMKDKLEAIWYLTRTKTAKENKESKAYV